MKVSAERRERLRKYRASDRAIIDAYMEALHDQLLGLPGMDIIAEDFADNIVRILKRHGLNDSMEIVHACILSAWQSAPGSDKEKLTLVGKRVIEFVESHSMDTSESSKTRFVELMAKAFQGERP